MACKLSIILLLACSLAMAKDRYFLDVQEPAPDQFGHRLPVQIYREYASEKKALDDTNRIDKLIKDKAGYTIDEVIIKSNGTKEVKKLKKLKEKKP